MRFWCRNIFQIKYCIFTGMGICSKFAAYSNFDELQNPLEYGEIMWKVQICNKNEVGDGDPISLQQNQQFSDLMPVFSPLTCASMFAFF